MNRSDFYFDLPSHLIAQNPSKVRGEDRLLVMNRNNGTFKDDLFSSLPHLLPNNALLVFNNSKVRHARVYATQISQDNKSESNKQAIEFLFIKTIDGGKKWKVLSPKMKRLKTGDKFLFGGYIESSIINTAKDNDTRHDSMITSNGKCIIATLADQDGEKLLCFEMPLTEDFFEELGHVPLPPYIKREDIQEDATRYQTVYASNIGSIAAPTAGLHFTPAILDELKQKGIDLHYLTLHVGLGTFLPVREEKIENHKMHTEEFFISENVAKALNEAKANSRPIIACGTTSVRTLEAAWSAKLKCIQAGKTSTNIFIYPPYHFNVVDGIITNFHTPESTLLMLVSAFCGRDRILRAYQHAVQKEYKFFSYGDAMLIL